MKMTRKKKLIRGSKLLLFIILLLLTCWSVYLFDCHNIRKSYDWEVRMMYDTFLGTTLLFLAVWLPYGLDILDLINEPIEMD